MKSVNQKILKNILFTITYYNVMGYLPNGFFVWRNMINPKNEGMAYSLLEVEKGIDFLIDRKMIKAKNGFLATREFCQRKSIEELYRRQIWHNKISTSKIKRAKKKSRLVRWLPYLKEMLLVGTLSTKRGGPDSDWDVLTVLSEGRIWLGRFMLSGWLHFLKLRRHGRFVTNRFCLNQFMVDKSVAIAENNKFIAHEILHSIPLLENYALRDKIISENWSWLSKIKPNFKHYQDINLVKSRPQKYKNALEWILEKIGLGEKLNKVLKEVMIKKIIANPKTYIEEADIRYGDFFLVFLPHPQREVIKKQTIRHLTKSF